MTGERAYTVAELIEELPPSMKVEIYDADTGYVVPKFRLELSHPLQNTVTLYPCDYDEMVKR